MNRFNSFDTPGKILLIVGFILAFTIIYYLGIWAIQIIFQTYFGLYFTKVQILFGILAFGIARNLAGAGMK